MSGRCKVFGYLAMPSGKGAKKRKEKITPVHGTGMNVSLLAKYLTR